MAENVASSVTYYLAINSSVKESLARIRHWGDLKLGYEDNVIWVKGFSDAQVNTVEVRSLPEKTIYHESAGQLYLLNSRLPDRNVPSVLWTPIDRALTVTLPAFNHNYFGIQEKIVARIIPTENEARAIAMITELTTLRRYMEDAPMVRLEQIRWCVLNKNQVFLLGEPLLPIPGETFWTRNDMLLPAGFDLEFAILEEVILQYVNPAGDCYVLWKTDSCYYKISREDMQPLSRSSFRMSYAALSGVE